MYSQIHLIVDNLVSNDWQYICIGCGKVVMAGADFNQPCPSCGSHGWMCHWLMKGHTSKETGRGTAPGRVITPRNELLPLKRNGNSSPGPKIPAIPNDLIKELAGQGLGVKAIASRLADQGMKVSSMTIYRRLQETLLQEIRHDR